MYLLEIDQALNQMHLTLAGTVDQDQAESLLKQTCERCSELKRGFHILNDIRNLESLPAGASPYIRKAMDVWNKHGVGLVVRVISPKHGNFGFSVMSHFHYDTCIPVVTCETITKAISLMVKSGHRPAQ